MAIPRVVAALFVLVLFWLALKLTRPALRGALNRAHFAPALVHLLVDGLYKGVVVVLGLVMAASQVGINVGAALAGIGVVGIAVGFAAGRGLRRRVGFARRERRGATSSWPWSEQGNFPPAPAGASAPPPARHAPAGAAPW